MKMNALKLTAQALLVGLALSSCQKNVNENTDPTGFSVSFTVEPTVALDESEVQTGTEGLAKAAASGSQTDWGTIQTTQSIHNEDDDVVLIQEEIGPKEKLKIKSSSNSTSNNGLKASTKPDYPPGYIPNVGGLPNRLLPKDVKYRVMVYDENNVFVEQVNGVVGSTPSGQAVNLKQNKKYKYFAYSYYSKDPIDPIAAGSVSNPVLPVNNEDLIYARGEFTTTVNNNGVSDVKVPLTFSHVMSMVQITVNTNGFAAKSDMTNFLSNNADRPYIQVAGNQLKKGSFNLLTGTFSDIQVITNPVYAVSKADYAYYRDLPSVTYRGFVYTVPGASGSNIPSFNYTISPWMVLDRPSAPKKFTKSYTTKINTEKGIFNRLSIYPFDSGIRIPSSNGATHWSRGDLYYDDSQFLDLEGSTRWQHRNYEVASIQYLSSLKPYGYANPVANTYGQKENKFGASYYLVNNTYPLGGPFPLAGNPCQSTQPSGNNLNNKWKMPTIAQGLALASYINANGQAGQADVQSMANGPAGNIILFVINNTTTLTDEWSQRIGFELKSFAKKGSNGSYEMNTATNPVINTSTGARKGFGYYWLYGAPEGEVAFLEIAYDSSLKQKVTAKVYQSGAKTMPTGVLPSPPSIPKDAAMSIRCVRDI